MIDKNEYDPVVEEIHKIRRKIAKETKGMTWEEEKEYYARNASEIKRELGMEKPNSISTEILSYYKSIAKDNYMELINSDLKRVIEFRKSL